MKDNILHMIGNAHLDPVWLWQWQEGFQAIKATFRSALDRMDESPDFIFTSSSAAYYEWIENNDPEMFAEIKARIADGRWQVVGGWWVQPDCNIPSGESFARQGLYGQRYFKEKFGVLARVGYNVDSFGHNAMLPQILRKSGMDGYIFMRPAPHEKGLPAHMFWWESDDGSRVVAFRIPYEYCAPGQDIEASVRRYLKEFKPPFHDMMCFYGVGNHGGGPTRANLDSIGRLNALPDLPRLVFSTPDRFFGAVRSNGGTFPVVHDEMQHHAIGCYAAHSGVKRWNRQAENLLLTAEKWSAVAGHVTGLPYPSDFGRAWKNVLFNQFHDILAGTSIEAAYDDARNTYGEAMSIAARNLNNAVQSLAWRIGIEHEDGVTPIAVFNPHSWPARVGVELEYGHLREPYSLVDDAGRPVALQIVQSTATCRSRNRLSFVADLPPLGYRVYRVVPRPPASSGELIQAGDCAMENDRFRLEIDRETGFIAGLVDKRYDVKVFRSPAAQPVVVDDPSDTWGHGQFGFHKAIGSFAARSVRLVEHGAVKSVIRVESTFGASTLIQDFTMYRDLDQIDVHVTVDWREQFKTLKLRFPTNLDFTRATYEIPYGHIERVVNGEEQPGQSWIDLSGLILANDTPYGLSLLNDGKYSFDILHKDIGLTVLRSPVYANHAPAVPEPGKLYAYLDQGIQRFTYTLFPHAGGWEDAGTVKRAAELNAPPVALVETYHAGPLPQTDSYLSVDVDNVIASVLKHAEDGDDLVIRCYETAKKATRATVCLPHWNRAVQADFGPCEIKTFRVPRDASRPVIETNLLEWEE